MEEKIAQIKKILRIIDKCKGVMFIVAVVMLAYTFIGGKVWADAQWFMESEPYAFIVLFFSLVAIIVVNLIKVLLAMVHNNIVRRMQAEK